MSLTITIEKCTECEHCRSERDYTSDSWETCSRNDCYFDRKNPKNIERYVDWNDKNYANIPSWCPRK